MKSQENENYPVRNINGEHKIALGNNAHSFDFMKRDPIRIPLGKLIQPTKVTLKLTQTQVKDKETSETEQQELTEASQSTSKDQYQDYKNMLELLLPISGHQQNLFSHTQTQVMDKETYEPEQQELTEVSQTINPASAAKEKETTTTSKEQYQKYKNILDLLLHGRHKQNVFSLPISSSYSTTITQPSISTFESSQSSLSDINKALFLLNFLTNIGEKEASHVQNSLGYTNTIRLLSRQPAQLIRPIIRFIAVQKNSSHDHWKDFLATMQSRNSAEAYTTLMRQIQMENRRQQFLVKKMREMTVQLQQTKARCTFDGTPGLVWNK